MQTRSCFPATRVCVCPSCYQKKVYTFQDSPPLHCATRSNLHCASFADCSTKTQYGECIFEWGSGCPTFPRCCPDWRSEINAAALLSLSPSSSSRLWLLFHFAVGRTIERVQPGKLVGLLDLEFTHPRRLFALHLFSFSSQSSAVRYREPIMEKNTREITIFSFFPPPDPDFSFSELHSERKKQMNSNLVYESRPFPHLKHGLVLEKNWDWTRGYDHLTRFDRCPAPITS